MRKVGVVTLDKVEYRKGDVLLVDTANFIFESVVVVQNNTGNQYSKTLIVAPIVDENHTVLTDTITKIGIVKSNRITTIDKRRVICKISDLSSSIDEIASNVIANLGYDLSYKRSRYQCNRGDIVYIPLNNTKGSEQRGLRPAMVLQNNIGNQKGKTTVVVPLTTKPKKKMPTHYKLSTEVLEGGESTLLFEQIKTIDKSEIIKNLGHVDIGGIKGIRDIVKEVLFK